MASVGHRGLLGLMRQLDLANQRWSQLLKATEFHAILACDRLPGLGSFNDEITFEINQYGKDAKRHFTRVGDRVDAVHDRDKFSALVLDFLADLQQMKLGSNQPINPSDNQPVALVKQVQHTTKLNPVRSGAGQFSR